MSSDSERSDSLERQVRLASASPQLLSDDGDSPPPASLKRKREDGDAIGEDGLTKSQRKKIKRKMKKQAAAQKRADEGLDEETGVNSAYAQMDGQLLADHVAQKFERFNPDSSALELRDMRIPGSF